VSPQAARRRHEKKKPGESLAQLEGMLAIKPIRDNGL
jgi:hypothetical protein